MRENNQRQIHSAADSYLKRSYYGLMSKSEASVDSDSNWLITLSDVFTLLLVFMVVFLVMTKNTTGSDELVTGSDIKVMPDVTYEKTIIETGIRESKQS
jgi:hypothetical protein